MSYRTIERDGRQHLVFTTGGDLDVLAELTGETTPPSHDHRPANAEVLELRAEVRELRRQLHEARQEAQGIRDQRDAQQGEEAVDASTTDG